MKTQDQAPKDQKLTDEFSGETEITYNAPENAPEQMDVTLAPESVFEGGDGEGKTPIVGLPDEELEEEAPKAKEVKAPKAKEVKAPEVKPDYVKTMRDNNLEIFTKENFTNDVSDEDFSNQLINDKFLNEQSYVNEIDYNTFEYYPEHISKQIKSLKEDVGRAVANLTPHERKTLAESTGGDEEVYNKYIKMVNDNMGVVAGTSLAAGVIGAVKSHSLVGGFITGAATAYSLIYGGAEILNAVDRAQRTSPEELKGMKKTKLNKPFVNPLLEITEEQFGMTPAVRQFINDMTERNKNDTPEERYIKEFSQVGLDAAAGFGIGKLLGLGATTAKGAYKGGKAAVSKVTPKGGTDPELMEKLAELLEIQKVVKAENKRIKISKQAFSDVEAAYAHVPPPIPTAANAVVDFNALAGEALDKYIKSGGKDLKAFEDFRINNVRGSNYKLNTKLVNEMPKDAAEAQVKALKSSKTYGKGAEGGGTTTMKYAEKFDELGAMRKNAIDRGDLDLDLHLATLQDDIEHRINISLTQAATNMQEVNRSMPLRRHMKTLQNEYAENASAMKQNGLLAKARKQLNARQQAIEKDLLRTQTALTEASSSELVTMGIANAMYTNMLGGAAIAKAALGGLVSTASNNVLLLQKGINPAQIFKMQANNLKRLQGDFRKFDAKQLRSDAVTGSINSRFKAKNVADVTLKETDSVTRKGLKVLNKGTNIAAAPIQIGLGTVDFIMDRFNRTSRVTEAWYDYAKQQQKLGRSSDDLVKELHEIIDDPSVLASKPEFYKKVMEAAETGLATDKMMLKTNSPAGYQVSRPAWAIDKLFNTTTNSNVVNTALKFVNPFTRTAASMLDSVAENSAIGMFRSSAPNGAFAAITARQMQGTVAAMGTAYALHDSITIVSKGSEKTAGAFGLRSGIQIGGHQFPMSTLGIYGDIIERFTILTESIESSMLDGTDTSGLMHTLGGLMEVLTVTGAAENVKQISQEIMNIGQGKSKVEVTKLVQKFAPAGYALKATSDLTHGSLAADPYLAQVFGDMDTKFGNAKRRSYFGTPLSEGETLELNRGLSWLLDRKGENAPEIKLNRLLLASGVYQQGPLAAFKTTEGIVPYSTIMVDGNYTPLEMRMTPLTSSVKIGGSKPFNVSLATKNKALGVMSLRKETMMNIMDEELTNLSYLDPISAEGKFLRSTAIRNLRDVSKNIQRSLQTLAQYGMDKPLPEALLLLMSKDAPNVTKSFDEKSYAVSNLMKFNPKMFDGNKAKQKKFFTRVNRTKDAVLYYNYMKEVGRQFMHNSAEAISTEIKRIEGLKER